MTPEALRARGERLSEELGRESYRTGAGLAAESHFADIFARYPDLTDDEAVAAARGHPALLEWVVDNRIGRGVAALDDRLHAWESRAVVAVDGGETIPYQKAAIEIANEARRARRLAIDAARRAILGEPAAIRRERLEGERELLAALGLGDPVAARSALAGIDLPALGDACGRFLGATADLYREALGAALGDEPSIPQREAERSDAAWLFRGAGFDDCFPGPALVSTAQRQLEELGLDATAGGRIRYDTEDRALKRARAFCAPVRIPAEVYLVIRPFGGHTDYRAFWHELGHAQHFGNAAPALPFEHRWLGDNSVTEGFAMLFEHMVIASPWLARYVGLRGERALAFTRSQAFALLAMLRRYAAKLRYELELQRAPTVSAGAEAYAPLLTDATGFRYAPEDALLDLDDGFYAARYLRAWQLEALLASHLTERFDEDWFRNPRCGPVLLELFAPGQRDDAATLAQGLGRPLDFRALVARAEAALG
ncbi:MAG TPA: hypothetical protein VMT21_08225 [Gemmatimonadales bacterium]|nr:hypothetical protein [Gemmatimonadales bacterium]